MAEGEDPGMVGGGEDTVTGGAQSYAGRIFQDAEVLPTGMEFIAEHNP